jgi:hypothetical protein
MPELNYSLETQADKQTEPAFSISVEWVMMEKTTAGQIFICDNVTHIAQLSLVNTKQIPLKDLQSMIKII